MNQYDVKQLVTYDPETGVFTRSGNQIGGRTAQGYLTASLKGKAFLLHRLAFLYMNDELPVGQVDHINGVRTDNRWANLRIVTSQQNKFNRRSNLNRPENMKNIYWLPKLNRYRVKMKIDNVTKHFGYFEVLDDAIKMAKEVRIKTHGEYARDV